MALNNSVTRTEWDIIHDIEVARKEYSLLHYLLVVIRYRFESFLECWEEDDFANAEFIEFERETFHAQCAPLEQHLDALGSLLRVFRHELLEVAANPGSLVVASQLYCVEISGSEVSGEEDLSFWDR